jgi:transitional endoplasmic reticulum ATPase
MATNNKDPKPTKVNVVKIEEHEGPLMLPHGLKVEEAIEVLKRELEYRNQKVAIHAEIPGFLPDVLHAFFMACKQKFGWVHNKPTPGFFGDNPPVMITIQTGLDSHVEVPWGGYELPGVTGLIQTSVTRKDGRLVFVLSGEVLRRDENTVLAIVEATKEYLRSNSIFRAQAFRITFMDRDGEQKAVPEPVFLNINRNLKNELVFSDEVEAAIRTNVFTPIVQTKLVRQLGVPTKRGILLSGRWGTGKSMTSTVVADLATENGWTFILCERADELSDVLRLAREYAPAVVFCEDIDRVMSGERSMSMDEVLNVIDGVESKSAEIMVILTTNHVDDINQAMLRPGRLDAVIEVKPPDAIAAERLMRLYARGLVAPDEDISEAGRMLDGEIPAVIQEVVERSKLAAIYRNPTSEFGPGSINSADLVQAAHSMRNQLDLLAERVPDERSPLEKAASIANEGRIKAAELHATTLANELVAAQERSFSTWYDDDILFGAGATNVTPLEIAAGDDADR